MNIQIIEFSIKKTANIVTGIGKSYISHPITHFMGGSIKWYEDKIKKQPNTKNG